jgi:Nitrogenase molybdenum-iron protein, alpha and beta chains
MHWVASNLERTFGTPYMDVNFFGPENTSESLRRIAAFYNDPAITERTEALIAREMKLIRPEIEKYRAKLRGKRAAIYLGGAYKAIAIIRQLRGLGMEIVLSGTQTGNVDEYENMSRILSEGTIIIDDANPAELEKFLLEKKVDVMIGGVKERFLAYKLGIGFVDHNHDRKDGLSGFSGAVRFAREVYVTTCSPVWNCLHTPAPGGDTHGQ